MAILVGLVLGSLLLGPTAAGATDCGAPSEVTTVRGELDSIEESERYPFSDDHYNVQLRTEDDNVEFVLFGGGDLLELGQTYEVELHRYPEDDGWVDYAYLHAGEQCGPRTTLMLVDETGLLVEIEKPPLFVSPISLAEFFGGFAIFVVLIGLFGRSRIA